MLVTKNLCARPLFGALCALVLAAAAPEALAQAPGSPPRDQEPGLASGSETTTWLIASPTLDPSIREQVIAGLGQALAGEQGRHLLGEGALREHIASRRPAAPSCLYGANACVSAESMAFDALDLALVIRVKIRRVGRGYEAAYQLLDRRGRPGSDRIVQGATPRALAFALVREIYDATGLVTFTTTPPGARVLVDGAQLGATPLEYRLPIGEHRFALELEDHRRAEGAVEVTSKEPSSVEVSLELMPGMLIFEQAPPGAQVVLEGRDEPISASQPIELEPGAYSYEIRAQGYASERGSVQIEPGLSARRSGQLEQLNPLLRDITQDEIAYNRYLFRASYDVSLQRTSFRGARVQDDELGELAFRRFALRQGEVSTDPRRFFATSGLRLDAGYSMGNFGLGVLSLAYLTGARNNYPAILEDLQTGQERTVQVLRVSRLQLRPFQLMYRYFWRNIVPTAELGLGLNFQWITVQESGATEEEAFSLRQTEAFWTLELGVQYYLTPNLFATARYNFHDHFNLGVGTEHSISLGVGGAFANVFGFEAEPPEKL